MHSNKKSRLLKSEQFFFINYSNNRSLSQTKLNSSQPIEDTSSTQILKEQSTSLTQRLL